MNEQTSIDWFNSIKPDGLDDFKIDFAVAVENALNFAEKKRVDLARDLQVSPARITKVLRGDSNLTMEVMHKIAMALNHKIHINLVPDKLTYKCFTRITSPIRCLQARVTIEAAGNIQIKNYEESQKAA